tara:strand:+ start:1028 stop:1633 length:606 start_codon:yes stop_codon:yes gene_type:complete
MIDRKKKIRLIQLTLLFLGTLILYFTYVNQNTMKEEKLLSLEKEERVKKMISEDSKESDTFYNIEYSGLDLEGNRYIIKSKEAFNEKNSQEIINMKFVEAKFYFKDKTILYIFSDKAIYNSKSLDITFFGSIKADYAGSKLTAEKAEYSNSKSYLIVSDDVKINDIRGSMVADKLLFDIKKQTLEIASKDEENINTNINIK